MTVMSAQVPFVIRGSIPASRITFPMTTASLVSSRHTQEPIFLCFGDGYATRDGKTLFFKDFMTAL